MEVERVVAKKLMDATGIPAFLEVPEKRPDEFITVEQTGTGGTKFARIYYLAVQSWAMDRRLAAEIADLVEEAVYDLDEEPNIFYPKATSTYRFPDPDSKQDRYQTTVELVICK